MSAYAMPGMFPPLKGPLSFSCVPPETASFCSDFSSLEREEKVEYEIPRRSVNISIKDARMDTARLVEALTTKAQRGRVRRRTNAPETVAPRSPSPTSVLQEDAMQFELSISVDGTSYTAVRSLPQIRRLQKELEEELEHRRLEIYGESLTHSKIPQLPEMLHDENGGGGSVDGYAGRGFSFINAMLRSYAPVLERWLRQVTSCITPKDSSSLRNFLWEPLHKVESQLQRMESLPEKLDAIAEAEEDNE